MALLAKCPIVRCFLSMKILSQIQNWLWKYTPLYFQYNIRQISEKVGQIKTLCLFPNDSMYDPNLSSVRKSKNQTFP